MGFRSDLKTLFTTGSIMTQSSMYSLIDNIPEKFSTKANFPASGDSDKLYIATDEKKLYFWDGSSYSEIYSILNPQTWTANTEVSLGGNLYGYRWTGSGTASGGSTGYWSPMNTPTVNHAPANIALVNYSGEIWTTGVTQGGWRLPICSPATNGDSPTPASKVYSDPKDSTSTTTGFYMELMNNLPTGTINFDVWFLYQVT